YYKAPCPFHGERTPSFVVDADRQSWRCFGACAEGGDIFSFAMKHHGWSFTEALNALGEQAGVEVRQRSPEDKAQDAQLEKLQGLLSATAEVYHKHLLEGDTDEAKFARTYALEKRGLSRETIDKFGIGLAPAGWGHMLDYLTNLGYSEDEVIAAGVAVKNDRGNVYDRFRNRLVIPIRDARGKVVGFGGRVLDPNDEPKYLNSPQSAVFDKSRLLFGFDLARDVIRKEETAVIVEGYMDVIQAHQAGFMNVVAQMGTAMTETQLKILAPRYAKKIVLALDSDAAGQSATRRSLETARQVLAADFTGKLSIDMRILQIPDAKDPDDLLREEPERWQSLVENATPVADYVIESETRTLGSDSTVQERETAARNILPILVASENNLYKQDNIQKLALKLRIPERELLKWAQEHKSEIKPPVRREAPPPAYNGNGARDGYDEPPPLDYDDAYMPPDDEEDYAGYPAYDPADGNARGANQPVRAKTQASPPMGESMEVHCLRTLFANPELFYQVNRKLRELANGNTTMMDGPLRELDSEDFSRSDYQALIRVFSEAVNQHSLDVMDYIQENLSPVMVDALQNLLLTDTDLVRGRVGGSRFNADFSSLWKKHERTYYVNNEDVEFLTKILQLRVQRLKRELDELSFVQRDSQDNMNDEPTAFMLGARIVLSTQAKHLLEAEISTLSARLM
ncbi:MAG: DNA primase, partial [Aggregatilineales bacterium]